MLAWEHASDTAARSQMAREALTQDEAQRLEALRERWSAQLECAELGLDLRRLQFARWLVQRGILTEEI